MGRSGVTGEMPRRLPVRGSVRSRAMHGRGVQREAWVRYKAELNSYPTPVAGAKTADAPFF